MKAARGRPEIAPARRAAFDILLRVESAGAWASVLLEHREGQLADRRDTGLLHALVLGVLRRRGNLDDALARFGGRDPARLDPEVRTALRLGAYGLLFLERVPAHASVGESVELVKRSRRRAAAGLVNAVLRKIAAAGPAALPAPPAPGDAPALARFHSHPAWWVERLVARLGWELAERLLEEQNRPAPTVLRVHRRRTSVAGLVEALEREGIAARPGEVAAHALRLVSGSPAASAALRRGEGWVQDEASQLVGELFGDEPGPRVADLCAAPGGKTLQLADALDGRGFVVAVDRHGGRLGRLQRAARRVGAEEVLPVRADMTAVAPFSRPFDQVLLDAPCSGSGTLRRRPEIRWRLAPGDPAALAARQTRLLDVAAGRTAPGGTLVYSVCSMEPEEGEGVVRAFLERHDEFRVGDARATLSERAAALVGSDGFLRTTPLDHGLDGFFAALLVRGRAKPYNA